MQVVIKYSSYFNVKKIFWGNFFCMLIKAESDVVQKPFCLFNGNEEKIGMPST